MDVMARADGPKRPAEEAVDQLLNQGFLDELMDRVDEGGVQLTGEGGFLPELVKRVLEAGLQAELTGHLGYEKHDPAGSGSGNSRNGSTPKRLGSEVGDLDLATPRDRNGSFDPRLVPKGQRRVGGLSEMIISLYSGGMTIRDIQSHLERTLGTELSHETIANITDAVGEEVKAWQTRPLEPIYPILYLDALMVKVRDNHQVRNKAAHIAVGVDVDGIKHVLGIWVQIAEGAKFWAGVMAELRNRGVDDVLIACCDGLTGFPEAIEATWPHTVVQTCVVHLIRASMRFISYNDRKAVAAALRPIYTLPPKPPRPRSWTYSRAPSGAPSARPRSGCGGTPGRVAPTCYHIGAPSEPDVRVVPASGSSKPTGVAGWCGVVVAPRGLAGAVGVDQA
jgi:putative transposase